MKMLLEYTVSGDESKQLRKDTPVIILAKTLMTQQDCTSSTPVSGHLYTDTDRERCSVLYHSSSPPVTEVTAAIEVETGTSTFRVRCSSTGGRALDMAVSGPNGYYSNISSSIIQPVGTRM